MSSFTPEGAAENQRTQALRLSVSDLPAADARRIGAFVALGSERLRHRWVLVTEGPAHALLTGLDDPPTVPAVADYTVVHIRVGRIPAGSDGAARVLASPVQFDDLVDALRDAEDSLGPALPQAPQAALPQAAPPAQHASPATARDAAHAEAAMPMWQETRFRLRRWPPSSVLQGSRYRVRLASFMSSRFLTLDELVALSNVTRLECAQSVLAFMDQSLLHVERRPVAAAHSHAPAAPRPAAAPSAAPPRGLLAALRRRLGISRGA